MSTGTLTITRITDTEGHGTCNHCGRDGLRWIATLSDGSNWGTTCARRVLGIKASTAGLAWTAEYTVTAATTTDGQEHAVWVRKDGRNVARLTLNGSLEMVGTVDSITTEYNHRTR